MENSRSKFGNWIRNSITARMLIVGFLLLVLLIPLEFVKSLITERSFRQKEVVSEINSKWGERVLLSGPILKVPFNTFTETRIFDEKTKTFSTKTETIIKHAFIFPEALTIQSEVKTKPLNRSIYESVVYTADIAVNGSFLPINLAKEDIQQTDILWDKIELILQTSNLKGIRNTPQVILNEQNYGLTPKYGGSFLNTLQSEPLTGFSMENTTPINFSFDIKINGSEQLQFIPIGKETEVEMNSNWHSPSFDGMYIPLDGSRQISNDGFSATWKVLQINRQFEQVFLHTLPELTQFAFGTTFIVPVDKYQKNERTAKYGFLVIGLTLLVFLMIQISSKIYIHPFQYVMIGLALVMFYTLLISISEHSSFLKAYVIAAAAVLVLITVYSRAILKGFKFPLMVCISLASLYGFIYVIIQLENYALLVGSIGLFAILAILMFASRKIDWGND